VRHYAAYGSNLDPARMRAYCPHSPMVGTGWLEGWRLTFAGEDIIGWEGSVSTVVESPGDRVFVALYDIHDGDAEQLDEIEGVTAGTYRKLHVRVSTPIGDPEVVITAPGHAYADGTVLSDSDSGLYGTDIDEDFTADGAGTYTLTLEGYGETSMPYEVEISSAKGD
jgi:gamma-glutamylcyclotransferase (GGCT)/AIG2-like uncharacterized protein YtfP